SKGRSIGLLMCAGGLGAAATAQAPTSAQVWDVRFVVDSTGPFSEGPSATQVGITIFARVGILPNTSALGTTNLGVSRVGASLNARIEFVDILAGGFGVSQGRVEPGRTIDIDGRAILDTNGQPLLGHFAPFRGSFSPQVAPQFLGSNTDPSNGVYTQAAGAAPSITSTVGSRQFNFGSDGTGPVGVATPVDDNPLNLIGDFTPVFRAYYFPSAEVGAARAVSVNTFGLTARYVVFVGGITINPPLYPLLNQSVTFQVPGPGMNGLALVVAVVCQRRRRR
ncbi:MAG: hypothetical protein AB7K52_13635, partial [Phycisphaerales bacterium]